MKKIFKIGLLVASGMVFSSTSYADAYQDSVAKGIANGAKDVLLDEHGKFPIKLDDISYLMDITSSKQYVVYDYKITASSKTFTSELLAESLKISLEDDVCTEPDFVKIFRKNDLRFLFRYQFSDKKTIPVTLSIDEICD